MASWRTTTSDHVGHLERSAIFHVDGTIQYGKLPVRVLVLDIDLDRESFQSVSFLSENLIIPNYPRLAQKTGRAGAPSCLV